MSQKYGRTYHYPFSPGTTSDDRINHEYWEDIQEIEHLVHTEKLDGENNCLNAHGVFARSHAAPTESPWTLPLRQRWELIKNDLGNVELFGENLYAVHSIGYRRLEEYYYVFAVRCMDKWLSWEEVKFYAALFDLPTVPEIHCHPVAACTGQQLKEQVIAWAQEPSVFDSFSPFTGELCTREGVVSRNTGEYAVDDFAHNVFKYVRKGHVEHTRMVLDYLIQMPAYLQSDEQAKEILWTAALLHDIEKRSTSVQEANGRISTHGHARKGEYTVREMLFKEFGTPFDIREQIAGLVRYHGLPVWFAERPDCQKKVLEASLRVDTSLLRILSEADVNGRIAADKAQLQEQVEFFGMYCREQHCWGSAYPFASPHARYHYFQTEDVYLDYVPFDRFKSRVILLSGLPGMGKDHLLKQRYADLPIVSLDDIRRKHKLSPLDKSATGWVVQQAKEQARVYLRKGESFVWNATNITRLMRQQLVDLFTTYDAYVKIMYIEKPYAVWQAQNRNREFPIPPSVLDKMLHKLEVPQLWEAHEVEYLCL